MSRGENADHGGRPKPAPKAKDASIRDRLPPQNLAAEQGVLGSILIDNKVLDDFPDLRPDEFYRDAHQKIYSAILAVQAAGQAIDALILIDALMLSGELDDVGGEDYIAECINSVPHSANSKYYAGIIRQKSKLRSAIEASHDVLSDAYSNLCTADQVVEKFGQHADALDDAGTLSQVTPPAAISVNFNRNLAARSAGLCLGLMSGWNDLDMLLNGFQRQHLILVAGRPGMGKTIVGLNIAESIAVTAPGALRRPVLFTSLEMSDDEIGVRLHCSLASVDGDSVQKPHRLTHADYTSLADAGARVASGLLTIDATPIQSVRHIGAVARKLKRTTGLSMIIVDYLLLVDPENPSDSTQEQVSKIGKALKSLARSLDVPVVALTQLNREVERRTGCVPRLSDLRDSGTLEQAADTVILLHRPSYYDANDQPGLLQMIVAKNRHGPTGIVRLASMFRYFRADDFSRTSLYAAADAETEKTAVVPEAPAAHDGGY